MDAASDYQLSRTDNALLANRSVSHTVVVVVIELGVSLQIRHVVRSIDTYEMYRTRDYKLRTRELAKK